MDFFAFIRHSDPTKVQIGEREPVKREVKLLKLIKGRTVLLNPHVSAASGDSGDSVDKLFYEGDDAEQEHSVEKDDNVLEETIAKDHLATIRSLILKGSSVSCRIAKSQDDGLADSMSRLNLRTFPPSKRYVKPSDDSYHSNSCFEVNIIAISAVVDTPVMTIIVTTTVADDTSIV
nr:hypothetical protein [Tanacetum cinerariifolium]